MRYLFIIPFWLLFSPLTIQAQKVLSFDPIRLIIQKEYCNENDIQKVAPHLEFFKSTGNFDKDSIAYFKGLSEWYMNYPSEREQFFKQLISEKEFSILINSHYEEMKRKEEERFQKIKGMIDDKGYISDFNLIAPHIPPMGCLPELKQQWIDKYPTEYRAVLYNEKKKRGVQPEENVANEKLEWLKKNDTIRYKQIISEKENSK